MFAGKKIDCEKTPRKGKVEFFKDKEREKQQRKRAVKRMRCMRGEYCGIASSERRNWGGEG